MSGNPRKASGVATAYDLPDDAAYSYETFDRIASDERRPLALNPDGAVRGG